MNMILTGTGTSHGVPAIGCHCAVCRSTNPKDKRNRCSAYITHREADGKETRIVIDTGPEFRIQAITYNIDSLDAVLLTHSHADHLNGLDDLRIFSHTKSEGASKPCHSKDAEESPGAGLPIYADAKTLGAVRRRFDYIFTETQIGGGKPKLDLQDCAPFTAENPLFVGSVRVIPIPMRHGDVATTGWLLSVESGGVLHSKAYLTDCNEIPPASFDIILNNCGTLDDAIIDGLREEPHATHFCYSEAMAAAERLRPRRTWLTHISHNKSHEQINNYCKRHLADFPALLEIVKNGGSVGAAYDGLLLD